MKYCFLFLLFFCWILTSFSLAAQEERGEIVAGIIDAGRFSWQYKYRIRINSDSVRVDVKINLIGAKGVSRVQLDRVKPVWEKEIENVWSNRFALVDALGKKYPIVIDVVFKSIEYEHDVIVFPGGCKSDVLNWHIMNNPQVAAHEFGHMIGVYDEYRGGALHPQQRIIDPESIMTSNPVSGKSFSRHYEQFRQWFIEKTGQADVMIQPLSDI